MPRKKTSTTTNRLWSKDWSLGVNVWVESHGRKILEEPAADLLAVLDRTHSISAAAKSLGISYRHAWMLLQEAGENAAQPLVATAVGGRHGGGTQLTEHGQAALAAFQQVQAEVRRASIKALARLATPGARTSGVVRLAAAISLQEVIAHALSEYALLRPMAAVRTIYGASNELADQIAAGAAIDLFISAGSSEVRRLAKAGRVLQNTCCSLATNGLAIVGNAAFAGKLRKPADLRRFRDILVVVADPACPLGKCTADFLKREALAAPLKSQLQVVDNSRAVVAALQTQEARLGVIFSSDARSQSKLTTLVEIPINQAHTRYEGAVTAASDVASEAHELLQFLQSEAGQRCFRRCGFLVDRAGGRMAKRSSPKRSPTKSSVKAPSASPRRARKT